MNILYEFTNGRSGAHIYLVDINGTECVYKTNMKTTAGLLDLQKKLPFPTPEIYEISETSILMEYIPGIRIKDFIRNIPEVAIEKLTSFIINYIDFSLNSEIEKYDYSVEISNKIAQVSKFVSQSVFDIKTNIYPKTVVHGDFTFDNLVYYNDTIYMLDFSISVFDSVYFDINKLRQDLNGLWFVRNEEDKLIWKEPCLKIYNNISNKYPYIFDDDLYKLMIARVLPYCKNNKFDMDYVLTSIKAIDH